MITNHLNNFIEIPKIESYVNRADIYRYLNGSSVQFTKSQYWTQMVEAVLEECLQSANPIFTHQQFEIATEGLTGELMILGSQEVKVKSVNLTHLLGDSHAIHIVGVTLGLRLDRKIQYYMSSDATKGVILDACASVVIEACCDYIQDQLIKYDLEENATLYHTNRYSPGYGDLALSVLRPFSDLIQMTKRTGIHVSEHFLMQPQKSVVFVLGVSKTPFEEATTLCGHKCYQCKLKYCQYLTGVSN